MGDTSWVRRWSRRATAQATQPTSRQGGEPVSPRKKMPQPRRHSRWLASREPVVEKIQHPPAESAALEQPADFPRRIPGSFRWPPAGPATEPVPGSLTRLPANLPGRQVPSGFRWPPAGPAGRLVPGGLTRPSARPIEPPRPLPAPASLQRRPGDPGHSQRSQQSYGTAASQRPGHDTLPDLAPSGRSEALQVRSWIDLRRSRLPFQGRGRGNNAAVRKPTARGEMAVRSSSGSSVWTIAGLGSCHGTVLSWDKGNRGQAQWTSPLCPQLDGTGRVYPIVSWERRAGDVAGGLGYASGAGWVDRGVGRSHRRVGYG